MSATAQSATVTTRPIGVVTDAPAIDEWLDRFDAIYEEAGKAVGRKFEYPQTD